MAAPAHEIPTEIIKQRITLAKPDLPSASPRFKKMIFLHPDYTQGHPADSFPPDPSPPRHSKLGIPRMNPGAIVSFVRFPHRRFIASEPARLIVHKYIF